MSAIYVLINDVSPITSLMIIFDQYSITDFDIFMGAEQVSEEELVRLLSDDLFIVTDKRTSGMKA